MPDLGVLLCVQIGVPVLFVQKVSLRAGSDSFVGVSRRPRRDLATTKTQIPTLEVGSERNLWPGTRRAEGIRFLGQISKSLIFGSIWPLFVSSARTHGCNNSNVLPP